MTLSRLRREEQDAQERLDNVRSLLRDAMKDLEDTRAETENAQETTTLLEKRATLETKKLTDARTQYATLEQELSSMEDERNILRKEVSQYTIELETVKSSLETAKKDLIYLRFNAQVEHDAYENTTTEHATQQSAKEREILTLKAGIEQLQAKKDAMMHEIDSHTINMEQDKKRIDETWAEIHEREEVIDRRAKDARVLRARLKKFCADKKIIFPIADE